VKEDVSMADVAYVESHRFEYPTLQITTEPKRDYLFGRETAHVVGYVGEASDQQLKVDPSLMMGDTVGRTGIERAHDIQLRGERGEELVEVNSIGRRIGQVTAGKPPSPATTPTSRSTSICRRSSRRRSATKSGAGVFLDPRNGEILAMVSTPAVRSEPLRAAVHARGVARGHRQSSATRSRTVRSRAVTPPARTYKLVVALAGLEAGIIDEGTSVHCGGVANFFGRPFRCWKKEGHGTSRSTPRSPSRATSTSTRRAPDRDRPDRRGIAQVRLSERRRGIDLIGEEAGERRFTGVEDGDAARALVRGETISVSIGQGPTGVHVLQMADFAAMLATGGVAYKPASCVPARERRSTRRSSARSRSSLTRSPSCAAR
jgi:penicillin-binding protein 2